jgi:hypothetical protein
MKSWKVVKKLTIENRELVISSAIRPCGKEGFYAHEIRDKTQWARIFGGEERNAIRINKSMRVKGKKLIPKPYDSEEQAEIACHEYAKKYQVITPTSC